MSINPLALRLERFGSFKAPQTFKFPQEPGLYFMLGKNEAEPRMTGNATGKSTVWKALTWLLYEKTPEGLRAGDVCNWDVDKGVSVALDFYWHHEDVVWTVTRTWGPNSWKLSHVAECITDEEVVDLAKDPQNPVLAELRLGFDPWLSSVLMAQGEDMFLDMKQDRQAALFSSVMDLDGWMDRAERASKAAAAQDDRTRKLERELANVAGRLDALERHDSAGDADRWAERHKERMRQFEVDHANLVAREKTLRQALEQAQGRETVARGALTAAMPDSALEDAEAEAAREVRRLEDDAVALRTRIEAAAVALKRLNGQSAVCPVCGRAFDTKHWQQEVERAERNSRSLEAEADQLTRTMEPARNRHRQALAKLGGQEDRYDQAKRALEDAERATARARSELSMCSKQLDGVEGMYAEAEREQNPFAGAIERARKEAERLRDEEWELRREMDDSHRQYAIKQYWVKGFKDIRLREIAAALSELEVEVNSCVTELGLMDWELEFRVDRETKSGKVQRGFSTFVRAPGAGGRAVPWEAWSGGEKQRLRVAANAGLGTLVRARTGCDFPLEVWDEPTNGLSPEGKRELFAALAARARREGRVIFLVDHQAHDFGGFAGTCTVIKTPSGSRIRASWD